uniref:Uncharacterized protein n=1 Tax=Gossypium raimondii TaxID=29730 RepID=A0A0D2Q0Q1_GOSRA|nr:hypothetical protein B456_001G185000 [Gossypium raimondii]
MEKTDGIGKENGSIEEKQSFKDGSICGYSSLHHLLSANLKPQLYQKVSRLLLGLNCGTTLETIVPPESAKALSSKHEFDLQMPRNSDGSSEQCKAGPDFFSFYACQIADLLSEDKNTLSNSNASELSQGKYVVVNDKESMDCSPKDVDSLFENNIGDKLSDFKKGRLKGLLRQSVNDISMEVDEV